VLPVLRQARQPSPELQELLLPELPRQFPVEPLSLMLLREEVRQNHLGILLLEPFGQLPSL
jgi:hypothetical protein